MWHDAFPTSLDSLAVCAHVPRSSWWHNVECRELWYRASLALQAILAADQPGDSSSRAGEPGAAERILVDAHNAVNQALLGVALGLPPSAFRRLVQVEIFYTMLGPAKNAWETHQANSSGYMSARCRPRGFAGLIPYVRLLVAGQRRHHRAALQPGCGAGRGFGRQPCAQRRQRWHIHLRPRA